METFAKHLYRWKSLLLFTRPGRKLGFFSAESIFLVASLFIFGGIGCAVVFESALVPSLLVFSAIALPIISFFRGLGYVTVSGLFIVFFGSNLLKVDLFSRFWIFGLGCVFIISWGLFWLGGVLALEGEEENLSKLDKLSKELGELQGAYQEVVLEKNREHSLLTSRSQSLERELRDSQELLKEACKKQEHLSIDLQVLSDQKNSWLEDYTVLHNEYVHLVAGDESIVFPWVCGPEVAGKDQESKIQTLQEKGMAFLQSELAEEKRQHKLYASRCEELSESLQRAEGLQARVLELQKLMEAKDKELESFRNLPQKTKGEVELHLESSEEKRYKCMYQQLREQFSEKDKTLSSVRKELFAVREQYLTLKREQKLNIECSLEDVLLVQELLAHIELLEDEIIHLEELVSHTLSL